MGAGMVDGVDIVDMVDRVDIVDAPWGGSGWPAVAALMHRQTAGDRPESIVGLAAPDQRIDPFSLQEMQYRPLESGLLIYSFGPNMTDDGGEDGRKGGYAKGDIVWTTIAPVPATE